MSAVAAERITSGPIDPDLEAALPGLARAAHRLRQLEGMLADPGQRYADLLKQKGERADIVTTFRTAAERHAIMGDEPWLSLLLIVEEADRLFILRKRQRPTLAQVLASLQALIASTEHDAVAADVEVRIAQAGAIAATRRWHAAQGASAYLEACRG